MSDEMRKFLDMAQGLQRDLDELGVTKPAAETPSAAEDLRLIIGRWRNMVEKRANKYLDTPDDFLGRMLLDEVAAVDAWLKEQDEARTDD